jgi:anaerobic selenocysteine-containing dehydrogenase
MQNVLTVCPYCGSGCGVYLGVEDGVVTGSSPSLGHPIGQGKLCKRGWHAHEFVRSPNRLRQPMVRKGGRLAEVSWHRAWGGGRRWRCWDRAAAPMRTTTC